MRSRTSGGFRVVEDVGVAVFDFFARFKQAHPHHPVAVVELANSFDHLISRPEHAKRFENSQQGRCWEGWNNLHGELVKKLV